MSGDLYTVSLDLVVAADSAREADDDVCEQVEQLVGLGMLRGAFVTEPAHATVPLDATIIAELANLSWPRRRADERARP